MNLGRRKLRWLSMAVAVARANDAHPEWKLAAVAVKGGSLLATGMNKQRFPPTAEDFLGSSQHAEIHCMNQVTASKLRGADLYVARVTVKGGQIAMAMPCSRCMRSIHEAGVSRVYFTYGPTLDADIIKVGQHVPSPAGTLEKEVDDNARYDYS